MGYPIHLAEEAPSCSRWSHHFLWLAGVILRENESLIVGKISWASFTARSHVVGAGSAN